jgi:hypothetical protein
MKEELSEISAKANFEIPAFAGMTETKKSVIPEI